VKVWSEILPEDMKRFLRRLPSDIIDDKTGTFIRKENNVVLVQYYPTKKWWWRRNAGLLQYVAYIDLREKEPRIQYRIPISSLPFVVLWIVIVVLFSFYDITALFLVAFSVLVLYIAHIDQRKQILRLINKKMQAPYV
jgi:hypothetical protein